MNEQVDFYSKLFQSEGWDENSAHELIRYTINKVQWVDFKLENVLVSRHSLKTMGLGPFGASVPLFLRNGELLGHSPILIITVCRFNPIPSLFLAPLFSSLKKYLVDFSPSSAHLTRDFRCFCFFIIIVFN
jgi:hypothetical protein